jgi:hypothetical protein
MAARPTAEDLERFRSVSPVAHADKVAAPLLFLLGAKDRRCAPAAAEQPCLCRWSTFCHVRHALQGPSKGRGRLTHLIATVAHPAGCAVWLTGVSSLCSVQSQLP